MVCGIRNTEYGMDEDMLEKQILAIIDGYLSKFEPLDLDMRKNWFEYDTTGSKEASKRLAKTELAIRELNSDPIRFAELKGFYEQRDKIPSDIARREIEILYLRHLSNQASADKLERLTKLERFLQETFNDYRAVVAGRELSPVEVDHILADSTDSVLLEKVWKAQRLVGPKLEDCYRDLVKLRNEIAGDMGFESAVELAAETNEIDMKMLERFYREVHKATEKPFRRLKEEYIDPRLAGRYGIDAGNLRPWHYQNAFFQEAPTSIFGDVDLDSFYGGVDSNEVIKRTIDFYGSMGVDVSGIIERSSLFPKPGKNPHAVAWYLDPRKPGSSVLVMNLPEPPGHPKASDASTLVHELAHDINYEAILRNEEISYLLRDPTMLTEAVAMLFEKQTRTREWLLRLGADYRKAEEAEKTVELIDYVDQIIFLRWAFVIYDFEKSFYADPDQDIGDLWWSCKERHQFLKRPEDWRNPDALAKYHIPNVSLLYYSNYAIGRVANIQFAELFAKKVGRSVRDACYFDQTHLGDWLMTDFLAQGERFRWDDFLARSTGKPLSVKAWKNFYIDSDLGERVFGK